MRDRTLIADSGVAKLVEKQMRSWELAQSQRPDRPETARTEVEDFVAISRAVGSGGADAAEALGGRIGWPVFDKQILHAMAGDNELRERLYASMDERDLGWLEENARTLVPDGLDKNDYFSRLTKTILTLARGGRAVFLGRAADLVLPRHRGLRVRLIAPREECVRRYAEREGLDLERAGVEVQRIERERGEFIRHHFGIDPTEPTRFDLVINTEGLGTDPIVELIVTALKTRRILI